MKKRAIQVGDVVEVKPIDMVLHCGEQGTVVSVDHTGVIYLHLDPTLPYLAFWLEPLDPFVEAMGEILRGGA